MITGFWEWLGWTMVVVLAQCLAVALPLLAVSVTLKLDQIARSYLSAGSSAGARSITGMSEQWQSRSHAKEPSQ
jgi:hypothetical protein